MDYKIHIREKGKGFQYLISYKLDNGNWKQTAKQGFSGKKEAKRAADGRVDELKAELKLNGTLRPEYADLTFGEFTQMLLEHERLTKEYNSILVLESSLRYFEDLNYIPMKDIRAFDIQKATDKIVMKGLKTRTIKHHLNKLSYVFAQAIEPFGVIASSPVGKIKLPQMDDAKTMSTLAEKALTKSEQETILNHLAQSRKELHYYYLCATALGTGLRIGELLGLTWGDVNFKERSININKQWKLLEEKKYGFGKLKKKNSYRIVPISDNTAHLLYDYKNSQAIQPLDNRVFPLSRNHSVSAQIVAHSKEVGIHFSMHTLRHTYATNLIANGVDFKTAAYLLGHDVEMTMKVYSHVNDDMKKEAARLINNIL